MARMRVASLLVLLCVASGMRDSTLAPLAVEPAGAPSANAGRLPAAPASAPSGAGARAEAVVDEEEVDEGSAADWVVAASPVAPTPRGAPAPPSNAARAAVGIEASDSLELEERTWAAAMAARQGNSTASAETVFPPDNRIRVTSTTLAPWRQLGRLTALINTTEELICTAAMIAPQYLLTAAHCVYLPVSTFLAPAGINYAAGQEDATVLPYNVVTAAQTFVPVGYATRANADPTDTNYDARRQYDWAVIKLQSQLGIQTGYFPLFPNYKNESINMFLAGYPADKSTNAVQMWYSKCVKQRILAKAARFSYTCDTDNGNSGGPVWINTLRRRFLIGVHVAGGTNLNYATRISTRVNSFIQNAIAQGG